MATCRHCGYEAPSFERCPLCGVGAGTSDADPTTDVAGIPPWEDPTRPFPGNFVDTLARSALRPDGFFRTVPFEEAAARPVLYYLLISIVAGLFSLWWTAVFAAVGSPFEAPADPLFEPAFGLSPAALAMLQFFLTPFVAVVGLVLWSGLLHLLVLVFARNRRGFRATIRAVSYAAGPAVLTVVPWIGGLVGFVWSLVLTGIGLREAHRTTGGAAAAVVCLSLLVPLGILFVLFVMLFASIATLAPTS